MTVCEVESVRRRMTRCDVKGRIFSGCLRIACMCWKKAAGLRGLRPALHGLGGVVERRAATLDG
jgi:hypothetical protein